MSIAISGWLVFFGMSSFIIKDCYQTLNAVYGSAAGALRGLIDNPVVDGAFSLDGTTFASAELTAITKVYGIFLDTDMVRICKTREEAEQALNKFRKAEELIQQAGDGETVSPFQLWTYQEPIFEDSTDEETPLRVLDL